VKHDWTRAEAVGRISASLAGSLLLYASFVLFTGVALPRLGVSAELAAGLMMAGGFLVWASAALASFWARSWQRAWTVLGIPSLVLLGATLLAGLM